MAMVAMALVCVFAETSCGSTEHEVRHNVLLIMCDDLNDYEGVFGGHPQARTPNIDRLADSAVIFANACSNAPVCAPVRAAMFTGVYPHISSNYGFDKWMQNPVLKNCKTIMGFMRENGYAAFGTGKLMHHLLGSEWTEFGIKNYGGPLAWDGKNPAPHSSVPKEYGSLGALDGTFASLADVPKIPASADAPGYTGWWDTNRNKPFRYVNDADRDPMRDEESAEWAVNKIRQLDRNAGGKPFFMGVGFSKPHTALVAPQKYFDMFPPDKLKLPAFKEGDASDCHFADNVPSDMKGFKFYKGMLAAFPDFETGIRKYLQAYLACVAFADDQVGKVLSALEHSRFRDNTIVIFTSDHGYDFGQKEYLFKNTLWEDSTRVPLLIRVPGIEKNAGKSVRHPVSLIDIYPTLADLCGLKGDTKKNADGADLSGHSLRPFIQNPANGKWTGPDVALTVVASKNGSRVEDQNYTVRSKNWRYILYQDGQEELYDHGKDPHEWTNLENNPEFRQQKVRLRRSLFGLVPSLENRIAGSGAGDVLIADQTQVSSDGIAVGGGTSENKEWIKKYFDQHPAADKNRDGVLTWPELSGHRGKK